MTYRIELKPEEADRLVTALYEHGYDLEDDGREGNPEALLLYQVAKQLKAQLQAK